MGYFGARVNMERLVPLSSEIAREIGEIKASLREHAVYRAFLASEEIEELNINAPAQKQALVFRYIGLRPDKKSRKTGNPSCDADFLEYHQDAHPILPLMLRWSELAKLQSSFVESLPDLAIPEGDGIHGVIHPWWRVGGARTWRLSCADPNLQNQAKVAELRRCFVPRPGYTFVEGDLSQAEPRIIASLSGEEAWIEAFRQGRDIYVEIYKKTKGVTEVSKTQRQWAKTLLLAVSYGLSPKGAAQKLGMSVNDAKELIMEFWENHSKILAWKEDTEREVRETGQVSAPHGKIRRFDRREINAALEGESEGDKRSWGIINGIYRQAVNFRPQSLCGHLALEIMVRSHKRFPRWPIVLQVHDSVLWEVPTPEAKDAAPVLKGLMEETDGLSWLKVPLKADIKVGVDWGSMEEVK